MKENGNREDEESTMDYERDEVEEELSEDTSSEQGCALELMMLREKLQKSQEQMEDLQDQLLRSRADFENFRRRMARDFEERSQLANEKLFEELLPIFDNFSLGLEAVQKPEHHSIVQGFEFILIQFRQLLTAHGVEAIGNEGDLFDPHMADAISIMASDVVADGHVIKVVRPGYRMGKKLLRPAMVIVSKGPEVSAAQRQCDENEE
ncbi:MAG: nucleotide exchange factor GrpE [Puniceicoccales bacterium]|nr:nucleotide exchange factor GrpE [Puniceicoccales bacterium]